MQVIARRGNVFDVWLDDETVHMGVPRWRAIDLLVELKLRHALLEAIEMVDGAERRDS